MSVKQSIDLVHAHGGCIWCVGKRGIGTSSVAFHVQAMEWFGRTQQRDPLVPMLPTSELGWSALPSDETNSTTRRCVRGIKRIHLVHSTSALQDDSHDYEIVSPSSRRGGSVSPRLVRVNSIPCWPATETWCASSHGDARRNVRIRRGYAAARERFGGCGRQLECRRSPGRGRDVSRSEACHEPAGGSTRGTGAGSTSDAGRVCECHARHTPDRDDGRGGCKREKPRAMRLKRRRRKERWKTATKAGNRRRRSRNCRNG